jgi:mono/diheme cytochrome c family protein
MPAWKDRLSDQQIEDIIAWFQSRWPDEQYVAWQDIDHREHSKVTLQR